MVNDDEYDKASGKEFELDFRGGSSDENHDWE
jgi:hypothetical protein